MLFAVLRLLHSLSVRTDNTNRRIGNGGQARRGNGLTTALALIALACLHALQSMPNLGQLGPGFRFQAVHDFVILALYGLFFEVRVQGSTDPVLVIFIALKALGEIRFKGFQSCFSISHG